jgi:hypothetical protein
MIVHEPIASLLPDGRHRVDVRIGDFDLWFEGGVGSAPRVNGDALVCVGLLPSMLRGEPLTLPKSLPVDGLLLDHLDQLQEIFLAWASHWRLNLRRIPIEATRGDSVGPPANRVLSFFSGGVDGTYTAIRNRDTITTALLLRGIDMQLANEELWPQAEASATRLAQHFGLPLATLTTNVRYLGYHSGLKWADHFQGAALAAIGHALGYGRVLVAATSSLADLGPYGSHPLTDPLWSSSTTTIVHEGAVPRTEKIRAIGSDPVVMEVLRVCWRDSGYNCGRCGKCLRTMVALHLLGIAAPTFPERIDWRAVGEIRLGDPSEWSFFRGLLELERERPDASARRALERIRRASLMTSGLRDLDAAFGGPVAWLKERLRSPGR